MNLINTEDKVRLVLQMIVAAMLWQMGNEWMAVVLVLAILPWNPVYPALRLVRMVGGWAAQPVADKIIDKPRKNRKSSARKTSARHLEEIINVG